MHIAQSLHRLYINTCTLHKVCTGLHKYMHIAQSLYGLQKYMHIAQSLHRPTEIHAHWTKSLHRLYRNTCTLHKVCTGSTEIHAPLQKVCIGLHKYMHISQSLHRLYINTCTLHKVCTGYKYICIHIAQSMHIAQTYVNKHKTCIDLNK